MEPNREDIPGPFTGRISKRLGLLLGLIFAVVLVIGGISLFWARLIYVSAEDVERQGRHIEAIHSVRGAADHLVSVFQLSLLTGAPLSADDYQKIASHLRALVQRYEQLEDEEKEKDYPDEAKELNAFHEIREIVGDLLARSEKLFSSMREGQSENSLELKSLINANMKLPNLVRTMNDVHLRNTKFAVAASRKKMWLIMGFYVAFIVIGTLLILGSEIVFSKTIVLPIRRLASATLEVARGNFGKRVSVSSKDEIGQLADSFNAMAERLEEHEKMMQNLATLKERERIARELHDGLAQVVSYLHLQLKALEACVASESVEVVKKELGEMIKATEEAYEEIRQSIFGLRTMVSRGLGLIPTLTEYLQDFGQQNNISVDLQIGDNRATEFSLDVEVQLIRIIQEALANIRKHARVGRGKVRFDVKGEHRCVIIQDDGEGFDPAQILKKRSQHFGLRGMTERAEAIGGTLEIEAAPGQGTKITVRLPLHEKS